MPKNGFPMPTAKNGFHILNLHAKKYMLKKKIQCQFTRKIPCKYFLAISFIVILIAVLSLAYISKELLTAYSLPTLFAKFTFHRPHTTRDPNTATVSSVTQKGSKLIFYTYIWSWEANSCCSPDVSWFSEKYKKHTNEFQMLHFFLLVIGRWSL